MGGDRPVLHMAGWGCWGSGRSLSREGQHFKVQGVTVQLSKRVVKGSQCQDVVYSHIHVLISKMVQARHSSQRHRFQGMVYWSVLIRGVFWIGLVRSVTVHGLSGLLVHFFLDFLALSAAAAGPLKFATLAAVDVLEDVSLEVASGEVSAGQLGGFCIVFDRGGACVGVLRMVFYMGEGSCRGVLGAGGGSC